MKGLGWAVNRLTSSPCSGIVTRALLVITHCLYILYSVSAVVDCIINYSCFIIYMLKSQPRSPRALDASNTVSITHVGPVIIT